MPKTVVEEALMLHLAAVQRSKGAQMPHDVDFARRARVYFLDAHNQPVLLDHVQIMWD